ncbi:hypothetical protein IAU59_004851 [Kwoniella sp. CBS 9459]
MSLATTSSTSLIPATPTITPLHHYEKRHVYLCGDETLSWQPEWYTASFFLSSRVSYDSAASRGPVQPPTRVYQEIPECAAILSGMVESASRDATVIPATDTDSRSGSGASSGTASGSQSGSEETGTATPLAVLTTTATVQSTFRSGGSTFATTIQRVLTLTPTSSPTSTSSLSGTDSAISSQSTSSSRQSPSSTNLPDPAATESTLPSINDNTCAGGWDWQGWATVASLGSGLIIGGLLWAAWLFLRSRMPGLYAPRTWFVPLESRPSRPWSIATFLLPFLHIPSSTPPYSSQNLSSLTTLLAGLKLAALMSILTLGVVLPVLVAKVPCLGQTAPSNSLGGRLGTLNDLSLLRLLDALDPSPDSPATTNSLLRLFQGDKRSLSSTITPAIDSARIRLIVILVLLAVLAVGGGLFVVTRTYASLYYAKKEFEEKTCEGMDMVFISSRNADGWRNTPEEGLRRWFKDWSSRISGTEKEIDIVGLFAVPDTTELASKVKDREEVLLELELAELNYISSFKLTHTDSAGDVVHPVWWRGAEGPSTEEGQHSPGHPQPPDDFVAPQKFYKVGSVANPPSREKLDLPMPDGTTVSHPTQETASPNQAETRFHEINRDSAMYGGRFDIGQRIKLDEEGNYVPDPSPESEETHDLRSGMSEPKEGARSPALSLTGPQDAYKAQLSPISPKPARRSSLTAPGTPFATAPNSPLSPRSGASLRPTLPTIASSHRHSGAPSALAGHYTDIRGSRARFKELNGEIERMQQSTFADIAGGVCPVKGWIVVGKGARWLPHAERIDGLTREDIIWDHVGMRTTEGVFWVKVALLAVLLAIFMIPVLGLTVATAPGFVHYLAFLRPIAESDGFGSAFVQGLVPTILLSAAVALSIRLTDHFAKGARCISRGRQESLAFKGTFYLLLFICVVVMLLIASLEYGLAGFRTGVQEGRIISDGAIFSTWFIFVLLLNLAFIVPALYLLQPIRLYRYLKTRQHAVTPRQKFRVLQPPSYKPSYALAPCLIAVFYASTLLFIFPLLCIPILLLIYLSFVANRHMIEHVFVDPSHSGTDLHLWTIRRFGWTLALQPLLYGLIMFSRNEWVLGAVSVAVAFVALTLSELLTVVRFRPSTRERLSPGSREALDELVVSMNTASPRPSVAVNKPHRVSRHSDLSLLNRVAALLPGYARLPASCPLPLPSDRINDLFQAERASYAKVELKDSHQQGDTGRYFTENPQTIKGLIYPPELMAPVPIIWLPRDPQDGAVAEGEAVELGRYHRLTVIVDPNPDPNPTTDTVGSSARRGVAAGNGSRPAVVSLTAERVGSFRSPGRVMHGQYSPIRGSATPGIRDEVRVGSSKHASADPQWTRSR